MKFYSLYRYLIAISKLRLGFLTEPEQGELELEGAYREPQAELVPTIFTRSPLIQVYLFNHDDLLCQCLELGRLATGTRPPRALRDRTPAPPPPSYIYLFIYF